MTKKEINSTNYRVVKYLDGTVIYQGWHKGCHIGGGGGLGGGSSYNAIGVDVLPKWRELDEKKHYKIIAKLKKAVSEGRLKVIPVGELVRKEDFIQVDGVTVPHESSSWKSFFKWILHTVWVWIFETPECPSVKRQRLKTLNEIKGINTLEESINYGIVEEQRKIDDEEDDEDDLDTEMLNFLGD